MKTTSRRNVSLLLALMILFSNTLVLAGKNPSSSVETKRLAGSNRYETSAKVARELGSKHEKVILASGESYPDALAGSVLTEGKYPILLTGKSALHPAVADMVKAAKQVIILGGENTISSSVEGEIRRSVKSVKRLAGANRYETALAIAQEVGAKNFLIASGENYPDALAGGGLSVKASSPILLVNKNAIPAPVQAYLKAQEAQSIKVLGGSSSISDPVYSELNKLSKSISRLAGSNRYETALRIAKEAYANPTTAVIASGQDFPDALSAVSLAGKLQAPVILSQKDSLDQGFSSYLKNCKQAYLVGGTNALSDRIFGKTPSNTEVKKWVGVYWDLLSGKTLAANKDMGIDDKKVFCLDSNYDHQFALVKAENFPNPLLLVMNQHGHVNIIHYDSIVTYTGPARATENSAYPEVYFSKDLKRIQLKETMSDPKNWEKWEPDYDESWLVETYFEVGRAKDGSPILNYARQRGLQGPIVGIEQDDTGLVPIITNAEGSHIIWKSYFNGQEKALSDQDFQRFISNLEPVPFKKITRDNFLKEVDRVSR